MAWFMMMAPQPPPRSTTVTTTVTATWSRRLAVSSSQKQPLFICLGNLFYDQRGHNMPPSFHPVLQSLVQKNLSRWPVINQSQSIWMLPAVPAVPARPCALSCTNRVPPGHNSVISVSPGSVFSPLSATQTKKTKTRGQNKLWSWQQHLVSAPAIISNNFCPQSLIRALFENVGML